MNKERIVTILIMIGLFGGLIGGPIASLVDYLERNMAKYDIYLINIPTNLICHSFNKIIKK